MPGAALANTQQRPIDETLVLMNTIQQIKNPRGSAAQGPQGLSSTGYCWKALGTVVPINTAYPPTVEKEDSYFFEIN